jgi:RNA polymerase sigma factor (sigma-70 family)
LDFQDHHSGYGNKIVMDCKELEQPLLLVQYFRSPDPIVVNRALICCHVLFYNPFKGMGFNYCHARTYTRHKEDDLSEDAFNRGLMCFYEKIRKDGFEVRDATVKTMFLAYCLMQLKGLVKNEERNSNKFRSGDPDIHIEKKENAFESGYTILNDENDQMDNNEELFRKGFELLDERSRNLILWRKYLKLKNEEIAFRTGLDAGSVNNEVYKSMEKLKKIINELRNTKR